MTKEQLHKQTQQLGSKTSTDNKRRRLIKSAVAIPVIMTLHSGAAFARTSNLVKAANWTEAKTIEVVVNQPQVVCIKSADSLGEGIYDLGDPVKATADLEPYIEGVDSNGNPITPQKSIELQGVRCEDRSMGNGGIMITASAWDSVGPKIGSFL